MNEFILDDLEMKMNEINELWVEINWEWINEKKSCLDNGDVLVIWYAGKLTCSWSDL